MLANDWVNYSKLSIRIQLQISTIGAKNYLSDILFIEYQTNVQPINGSCVSLQTDT